MPANETGVMFHQIDTATWCAVGKKVNLGGQRHPHILPDLQTPDSARISAGLLPYGGDD